MTFILAANTAGFNDTTSIPAKHDSSTNDATGWDSLSNGVHLAIYIAAPVVAFFLFVR